MEIKDEFDLEFGLLIREIENYSFNYSFDKSVRIRINNWCKKISQVSNNLEWKKNRNLHAINLLNMLINSRIEEPYNKNPNDGPLPILSKTLVKSKLTYKFWDNVKHIYNSTLEENKENKTNYNISKKIKNEKWNEKGNLKNLSKKKYGINDNYNNIINKSEKNKIKRVQTPTTFHRNLSVGDSNKRINNFFRYNGIGINLDNNSDNELKILRETAIKLEQELNMNEEIIEAQKKENHTLKNKIMKLTEILKTLI